jgi:FKBP-type peptidyl-prolyl cis-trans isomerase FkpA
MMIVRHHGAPVIPVRSSRPVLAILALLCASGLIAGCGDSLEAPTNFAPFTQTDLLLGTGTPATNGATLTVHYTGWLFDEEAAAQKGPQFDSSAGRDPLAFVLGSGQVIPGWDQGLPGMRVGGIRRLIIPPSLAYGGIRNQTIPPNSTLVFEVELIEVE